VNTDHSAILPDVPGDVEKESVAERDQGLGK
jgi:hypothetical protein